MSTTGNYNDDDCARYDYHEHPSDDDDYPGGHNHVTTHDHHASHHHDRNGSVLYYVTDNDYDNRVAVIVNRPDDVDSEPG
jgi:hypothetical protein